jgi:hypothetical protein
MDVVRNVFQMVGVIGAGYFATKVPNSKYVQSNHPLTCSANRHVHIWKRRVHHCRQLSSLPARVRKMGSTGSVVVYQLSIDRICPGPRHDLVKHRRVHQETIYIWCRLCRLLRGEHRWTTM